MIKQKSKLPPGQDEVEQYFDALELLAEDADPFNYWLTHSYVECYYCQHSQHIWAFGTSREGFFSMAGESMMDR